MNPIPLHGRLPVWLKSALWTALAAGTGSAVLILLMVLFHELHLTGTAADWLGVLCNIVIAGTAVAAFKVARSWLPQMATQEGYKLAITLVNEHYICLGLKNSLALDTGKAVNYIRHQVDRKSLEGFSVTADELIDALEIAVRSHKTRQETMEEIRFRLATYGLRESDAYRDRFQALDQAYMIASAAAAAILVALKSTKKLQTVFPSTDSELMNAQLIRELYIPDMVEAVERQKLLLEQFRRMVDLHDDIFASRPPIGKLYEVE